MQVVVSLFGLLSTSSVIEAVESCNSFCSTIIDLVATVQMLKNIF